MLRSSLAVLTILGALGVGGESLTLARATSQDAFPKGIYWLGSRGQPVPEDVLKNPSIRGVVLRIAWQEIEPKEGRYDWSYFDREITRAVKWAKAVSLRVVSGGRNVPSWVHDRDGITHFRFIDPNPYHKATAGKEVAIPVFWDSILLEKQKQLLRAWGTRYGGNPHVVTVNSPCANAMTGDWNVPASTPKQVQAWRKLGYAPEKLITACRELLDVTAASFPNTVVVIGIGGIRLDRPPSLVAQAMIDYGYAKYPGRFMAMRANLFATTPVPGQQRLPQLWKLIYDHRPAVGAQMLWFVTGDTTFRMNGKVPGVGKETFHRSLQVGIRYGLSFLEVYHRDLINPDFAEVVEHAAAELSGLRPASWPAVERHEAHEMFPAK